MGRLGTGVVALALAVGAAALASSAFLGGHQAAPQVDEPESVDLRVTARIRVGGWPQAIAVGEGGIWVSVHVEPGQPGGGVVRIDPATNEVAAEIQMPHPPSELVAGLGAVWASGYQRERGAVIYRIDPATNEVTDVLEGAGAPLAIGDGVLWASRHDPETLRSSLVRVDPSAGRIDAEVALPITYPSFDVEVGEGSVWVSSSEEIVEVDPTAAVVVGRQEVRGYSRIAVGAGAVWTGGWAGEEVVFRLDTQTNRLLEPEAVPGFGIPAVLDSGGLWFLRGPPRESLCRLDPVTFEVHSCAPTGEWAQGDGPPPGYEAATGTFWMANFRQTVTRMDLLT